MNQPSQEPTCRLQWKASSPVLAQGQACSRLASRPEQLSLERLVLAPLACPRRERLEAEQWARARDQSSPEQPHWEVCPAVTARRPQELWSLEYRQEPEEDSDRTRSAQQSRSRGKRLAVFSYVDGKVDYQSGFLMTVPRIYPRRQNSESRKSFAIPVRHFDSRRSH